MAENVITNANDVELVIELVESSDKVGTNQSMGRMVVDDFSITREEDDSLVSGVGMRLPAGLTRGDITFNFSFTMMGSDTDVFDIVSDDKGRSRLFNLTARKVGDDGSTEWEYALQTCSATSEELSGSTGDAIEYPVEGVAVRLEKGT